MIADAYKGGTVRLVAGSAKRPPHFIIAQPEIKTLADLKGKLIGVVSMHEGTTFFVADMAKAGGFTLADVKVEAVGGSPTRQRLLKEKKIDAGLQPYPLSYEAEAAGFSNLGPIAKLVPDYQFTAVMVDGWLGQGQPRGAGRLPPRAAQAAPNTCSRIPTNWPSVGAKELAHHGRQRAARHRGHREHGRHVARPLPHAGKPQAGVRHHAGGGAIGRDVPFDPASSSMTAISRKVGAD